MRNNKGFTLIEMLVGMIVTSFLVLTIVYISSISHNSYQRIMEESSIFTEVTYGFKLLQNRVHESKAISLETASGNWASQKLIVGDQAFGLYQTTTIDFVYLPDKDDVTTREVIMSIPTTESVTPTLTFTISGKSLTAQFTGTKYKIPFDLTTTIRRRV